MEERKSDQYAIDVFADHAAHTQHILLAIILTLAVLLVACVGVIIWQTDARVRAEREHAEQMQEMERKHAEQMREMEQEYEAFETYEYEIEQAADNGSNNYLAGRDLIYGSDDENQGQGD